MLAEGTRGGRKAGLVGRILRGLLAGYLFVVLVSVLPRLDGAAVAMVAGFALGLTVVYSLLGLLIQRAGIRLDPWFGGLAALVPLVAVYVALGAEGQLGALAFLLISLAVAAVRADGGCEVMSIPGLLFGSRTHLVCVETRRPSRPGDNTFVLLAFNALAALLAPRSSPNCAGRHLPSREPTLVTV